MNAKDWLSNLPTWGFMPASQFQALTRREQEFTSLLEAFNGGHWEWEAAEQILHLHGPFFSRYGLSSNCTQEKLPAWINTIIHPDDRPKMRAIRSRIYRGTTDTVEGELRVRGLDGHWHWLMTRAQIVEHDGRGRGFRAIGITVDITERRGMERALRMSEAKYNTIYQNLPDAAGILRIFDGRCLEANAAFSRLLGYSRQELIGRSLVELGIWNSEEERARTLACYHRNGCLDKYPVTICGADRRSIPGVMSAYPISVEDDDCLVFVFHDMTEETLMRREIEASHSLLQQAGRLAGLGVWEDVPGQGPVYWSDMCYDIHGLPRGAPLPKNYVQRYVAPAWHEAFRAALRSCIYQRVEWSLEVEIIRSDGRLIWVRTLGEPVIEGDRVVRIRGVMQDIDATKRAQERVVEREALLSLTLEAASLGLWDWDLRSGRVKPDTQWLTMHGLTPTAHNGQHPLLWSDYVVVEDIPKIQAELTRHATEPGARFDVSWRVAHPDGQRWIRNLGKTVAYDDADTPTRMLGVSIDVTAQREQEQQLQHLAHHDALTGLPNRVLLARQLADAMHQARTHGALLGVAYLDLDGFKPINDRYGHEAGDQLLVMAAQRLTAALRSSDCVARLGGDEFAILLPNLRTTCDCELTLRQVMQSLAVPYALGHECEWVSITASVGYTLYPHDESDADALLRHADQAMYIAKQSGRNCFYRFDAASAREARQVQAQTAQLRAALAEGQFVLFLQPKVDMRRGTVVGAEALARWQHPEKGLLSPAAFLSMIQGLETEVAFGTWVTEASLAIAQQLQNAGLQLPLSINISAHHLQLPDFAHWFSKRLTVYPNLPRGVLEIEITETAALYNLPAVAQTLRQLHAMGVNTALDDFGTGYSSLTYLRRLPLDTLKIDQSFVRGMVSDRGDLAIVQGVIGLARSFGYHVIAEGVETEDQGGTLLALGCHLAQGYYIARPMSLPDFIEWARCWKAPDLWLQAQAAPH